ncbi:hypothetical protein [Pedobacter sp. UYEF25]
MKVKLLLCFFFITAIAEAQTLKLKPGEKFGYEGISSSGFKKGEVSSYNYSYWRTNFEVISHKNGLYTLKASPEQFLYKWSDDLIVDSKVAFSEQPLFEAVANKVMTENSYELVIDNSGNIKSLNGLAKIKAAVLAKAKEMRIPETAQKHKELVDLILNEQSVYYSSNFFARPPVNLDTTYKTKTNGLITSVKFKQFTNNSDSTGLITSSTFDSVAFITSALGGGIDKENTLLKFSLIQANRKDRSKIFPLLKEATKTLNYGDYYSPIKRATRKIDELANLYEENKGSQTIEAEIMSKLDSMDKGFAKDDMQYLGAKLGILGYVGDGYSEILQRVPYKFLPSENDVQNKMNGELERGDFSNVKDAIEFCFTKFKGEDYYPLNMMNTSDAIHNDFGGLVFRLKNRDSLIKSLEIIEQIGALNIPIATETFAGLKTYVRAKLATSQSELSEIANTQFNAPYDKAGRYRILIYDELLKKHVPDSILVAYIDYTIDLDKKKMSQLDSGKIENVSPSNFKYDFLLNKVVDKKNLADAYYRKSQLQKGSETAYIQMAADYLPSQQDIIDNQFGLEAEYKFTPFVPYTDVYLASGGKSGLSEEARLQKYVDMVIMEPERYGKLKEDYFKAYPTGNFKAFFSAALKSKLPVVPQFSLNERSGIAVANKDQKGKFIFVDF